MISQLQNKIDTGLRVLLSKVPLNQIQVDDMIKGLGFLAFNLTRLYPTAQELKERLSFISLPKEMLPSAFYENQALAAVFRELTDTRKHELVDISQNVLEISIEEENKGKQILEWGEKAGFITRTEKLIFFRDTDVQTYFCVAYCQQQLLDYEFLLKTTSYNRFKEMGKVWAELDPLIINKLAGLFSSSGTSVVKALAFIGTPQAILSLLQFVNDSNQDLRVRSYVFNAFEQFINLKDITSSVVQNFVSLMKDPAQHAYIRNGAARTLGVSEDLSLAYLAEALMSEDEELKLYSLEGLVRQPLSVSASYLISAIKDMSLPIKRKAMRFLLETTLYRENEPFKVETIWEDLLEIQQNNDFEISRNATEILAWYRYKPAIQMLSRFVNDESKDVDWLEIMEIFIKIKEPEAAPIIIALLSNPSFEIAAEAGRTAEIYQEKRAIQSLLTRLKSSFINFEASKNEHITDFQMSAVYSLISLGATEVLDFLLALYYAGKLDVGMQENLAEALVKFNHPQAYTILKHHFLSNSDYLCLTSAKLLVELKGLEILPFFLEILDGENSSLDQKKATIRGLAVSGSTQGIPILLKILEGSNHQLRSAAISALGQLKSREALGQLEWIKWNDLSTNWLRQLRLDAAISIELILAA